MKILQVIPSYWPAIQFGGTVAASHALNKVLVQKGVDLTVYTTSVGLEGKVPVDQYLFIDGVKVRYCGFVKALEFFGSTGWQFSPQFTNILNRNIADFDVVHIIGVWNYPTTLAAVRSWHTKKPFAFSPHGALYPYTAGKKFWKKWLYYQLFLKSSLKGAAAFHYTSEDEAKQCHRFLQLPNPYEIIPNGIDLTDFGRLPAYTELRDRYPELRGKKVLLFLGRINWKKGIDILIRAFARVASEKQEAHLLIVGNDEENYRQNVERWLTEYGIEERTTFTGPLKGKDKLMAFSGSDLFVLPSYSENFGMTVVEAMACGLPIVISDQVGISPVIRERNAGIVVKAEIDCVYQGIMDLLCNDATRKACVENGKKTVYELYDIHNVADRMIRFYAKISETEPGSGNSWTPL